MKMKSKKATWLVFHFNGLMLRSYKNIIRLSGWTHFVPLDPPTRSLAGINVYRWSSDCVNHLQIRGSKDWDFNYQSLNLRPRLKIHHFVVSNFSIKSVLLRLQKYNIYLFITIVYTIANHIKRIIWGFILI